MRTVLSEFKWQFAQYGLLWMRVFLYQTGAVLLKKEQEASIWPSGTLRLNCCSKLPGTDLYFLAGKYSWVQLSLNNQSD